MASEHDDRPPPLPQPLPAKACEEEASGETRPPSLGARRSSAKGVFAAKKIAHALVRRRNRRRSMPAQESSEVVTTRKISKTLIAILSEKLGMAGHHGLTLSHEECDVLRALIKQQEDISR